MFPALCAVRYEHGSCWPEWERHHLSMAQVMSAEHIGPGLSWDALWSRRIPGRARGMDDDASRCQEAIWGSMLWLWLRTRDRAGTTKPPTWRGERDTSDVLPPGQRAAVTSALWGRTHSETAEHLGISVGAIKTRPHKARTNLRRALLNEHGATRWTNSSRTPGDTRDPPTPRPARSSAAPRAAPCAGRRKAPLPCAPRRRQPSRRTLCAASPPSR